MKLLVASTNRKKLGELRALAQGLPFEIVGPADLDRPLPEVVEDAPTFEGNARKKALAFAAASGLATVADDSGICVDALDGAPGIRSARYAGDEHAPDRDEQNNAKLLRALAGVPEAARSAAYHCALCLALPDGSAQVVSGRWEGRIGLGPRGDGGFGYDPLFLPADRDCTAAELAPDEKAAVSHRGRAMQALRPLLEALARSRS